MSRSGKIILGVLGVIILITGAAWAYDAVLGETEAASGPIEAVPIGVATHTPEAATASDSPYPAEQEGSSSASAAGQENPYPAATGEASVEGETTDEGAGVNSAAPGVAIFSILPEESEVRFVLGEILNGSPKTVVGVTDQVAGEIALDLSDLTTAQIGEILVNARTLVTDSDRRNRAIRNQILVTDAYEFISFTPTEITGLSGSAAVGETLSFQILGDLTIRDVTNPVVFDVSATLVSDGRIEGTASTVIVRGDYGLTIPSVPSVAGVDEEITLEIDFVAGVKS